MKGGSASARPARARPVKLESGPQAVAAVAEPETAGPSGAGDSARPAKRKAPAGRGAAAGAPAVAAAASAAGSGVGAPPPVLTRCHMPLLTPHHSLWRTGAPVGGAASLAGTWHVYGAVVTQLPDYDEVDRGDALFNGESVFPCSGTLVLAAPASGKPLLKGALRGMRYGERYAKLASKLRFPVNVEAAVEVLATPSWELCARDEEDIYGLGYSWAKMLRAHGAGALPAHVKPGGADVESAAPPAAARKGPGRTKQLQRKMTAIDAAYEDWPPIALLECCASRAELPALSDGLKLRTVEVHAAADVAFVAEARARWAQMSAVERRSAADPHDHDDQSSFDSEEVAYDGGPKLLRPDFFDVVDLQAPPLVILPGDVRLTVRWEEPGRSRGNGRGTALLLRRVLPAAPPAVALPAAPMPHYKIWQDYRDYDCNTDLH